MERLLTWTRRCEMGGLDVIYVEEEIMFGFNSGSIRDGLAGSGCVRRSPSKR
jgi:hypothetical protein